jgi:hypothetical protein
LSITYLLQPNFNDIFKNQFLDFESSLEIKGNILITGSKGMIGNALACAINELQARKVLKNLKLILCSRTWEPKEAKLWENFSNVELVKNSDLSKYNKSVDYVIHTASPSNITKINAINDLRVPNLDMLKNIFKLNPKKILYISSSEVTEEVQLLKHNSQRNFHLKIFGTGIHLSNLKPRTHFVILEKFTKFKLLLFVYFIHTGLG